MRNYMLIIIVLLFQTTSKTQVTFEKIITKGSTETTRSVNRTFGGGYAFPGKIGALPG